MYSSYTISFFFREKCLSEIAKIYAISSKSNFLNVAIAFSLSEKETLLSRTVYETLLIKFQRFNELLFVPRSCIEKRNTTIRIKTEWKPFLETHFKRLERFINETFIIFYENESNGFDIEEFKMNFSPFSSRLGFLLNFGFVASVYKAKDVFKLKF